MEHLNSENISDVTNVVERELEKLTDKYIQNIITCPS